MNCRMCPLKCQLWLNYRHRNHNFKLFCWRLYTGSLWRQSAHFGNKKSVTSNTCWTRMYWNCAFYQGLFYKRTAETMLLRFQSQIFQRQWIDRINHCRTQDVQDYITPLAWPRPTGSSQLWVPAWADRRALPSLEQHPAFVLAGFPWVPGLSGCQPCFQA